MKRKTADFADFADGVKDDVVSAQVTMVWASGRPGNPGEEEDDQPAIDLATTVMYNLDGYFHMFSDAALLRL